MLCHKLKKVFHFGCVFLEGEDWLLVCCLLKKEEDNYSGPYNEIHFG